MNSSTIDQLPDPENNSRGWPWKNTQLPTFSESVIWPRISIVTPSYNQGHYLEETIRSVLLQAYPNLEYIILDGGSTDNSVDIIKKYAHSISYWVRRKDQVQSDAINKGFDLATGSLFGWLNSDDIYLPGALQKIATIHLDNPDALILGTVHNFHDGPEKKITDIVPQINISLENLVLPGRTRYSWHQPGVLFPRQLYFDVGGLDPNLHYGMDHDLMCRFMIQNVEQVTIPDPVAGFRVHPRSKSSDQNTFMAVENYKIKMRYWDHLPIPRWILILSMKFHFILRALKLAIKGKMKDSYLSLKYGLWKSL